MWTLIILAYFVPGAIIFGLIDAFSNKYKQWYTVNEKHKYYWRVSCSGQ